MFHLRLLLKPQAWSFPFPTILDFESQIANDWGTTRFSSCFSWSSAAMLFRHTTCLALKLAKDSKMLICSEREEKNAEKCLSVLFLFPIDCSTDSFSPFGKAVALLQLPPQTSEFYLTEDNYLNRVSWAGTVCPREELFIFPWSNLTFLYFSNWVST